MAGSRRLSWQGRVTLALFVIAGSVVVAHEGHGDGKSPVRTDDLNIGRTRAPLPDNSSGSDCAGCCAAGACRVSGGSGVAVGQLGAERVRFSGGPAELDRLAGQLSASLQSEMRGSRYYLDLVDDAALVQRQARRLRQMEVLASPPSVLLEEARKMIAPIRRMKQALASDMMARRSYPAARELGDVLVLWARGLQRGAAGPKPQTQERQLQERQLQERQLQEPQMQERQLQPPGPQAPERPVPQQVPERQSPIPPLPGDAGALIIPDGMSGLALLPGSEQAVALQQRVCPVTGQLLGSMGRPIRVDVDGRSVFVCCQGCVDAVRQNPGKYLRS